MIKFPINKRKTIISSLVATTMLTGIIIAATPGSSGDPLITLSYFEQQITKLKEEFKELKQEEPKEEENKTQENLEKPNLTQDNQEQPSKNLNVNDNVNVGVNGNVNIKTKFVKLILLNFCTWSSIFFIVLFFKNLYKSFLDKKQKNRYAI